MNPYIISGLILYGMAFASGMAADIGNMLFKEYFFNPMMWLGVFIGLGSFLIVFAKRLND